MLAAALKARRVAESEVVRLERAVSTWEDEAERTAGELAELEASAGQLMNAEDPHTAARDMAGKAMELRFLIDGARAAAQTARQQLVSAREELALAQAVEKRQAAAKLIAEADEHQAKVDALLDQLQVLDGVRYVPRFPTPEEQQAIMHRDGRVEITLPTGEVLRQPIAPLLAEAEALEAPVLEARRVREAAFRPLVPSARIDVPAWDDIDADSTITCAVTEGAGQAEFEILAVALDGGRQTVTLPDESGRRSWSRRLRIQAGGGSAEIRCNGQVLAKETRPGRLLNDGVARWWVER